MVQPTKKVQKGSISLAEWDNPKGKSYTLQKSFKPKDSEEWKNSSITVFDSELDAIKEAIDELRAQ